MGDDNRPMARGGPGPVNRSEEIRRKRRRNERKFGQWEDLPDGSRRYFYEVKGRTGWKARYVKEVDADERTIRFYQEIYDEQGELAEIHQKYPVDTGHQRVSEGRGEAGKG